MQAAEGTHVSSPPPAPQNLMLADVCLPGGVGVGWSGGSKRGTHQSSFGSDSVSSSAGCWGKALHCMTHRLARYSRFGVAERTPHCPGNAYSPAPAGIYCSPPWDFTGVSNGTGETGGLARPCGNTGMASVCLAAMQPPRLTRPGSLPP